MYYFNNFLLCSGFYAILTVTLVNLGLVLCAEGKKERVDYIRSVSFLLLWVVAMSFGIETSPSVGVILGVAKLRNTLDILETFYGIKIADEVKSIFTV